MGKRSQSLKNNLKARKDHLKARLHQRKRKSPEGQEALVSVIIPNYNGEKVLGSCLDSVFHSTIPLKIIVVDNGSRDGSRQLPQAQNKKVKWMQLPDNTGFAHGVNVGIREADTPYVFLLNNDARVEADTAERLLMAIRKSRKIFSVQAKMLSAASPHRIDSAGDLYCSLGIAYARGKDKDRGRFDKRAFITSACAGAAIYRRELVGKLGLFDDAHFCYLEDVDIGIRARLYGYYNLYEPSALVYHIGSAASGSRHNPFKVRLSAGNNLYVISKNFPAFMVALNIPFMVIGHLIKALYFLRKGLLGPYVKGLREGFQKIDANEGRQVPFRMKRLPYYVAMQLELYLNVIRRVIG